jgi:hypothetical protein
MRLYLFLRCFRGDPGHWLCTYCTVAVILKLEEMHYGRWDIVPCRV